MFVNRYFFPDESATAQLLTDLALALRDSGERIEVICSRQRYDDAQAQLPKRDRFAGVEVRRVWTSRFGRSRLAGRALDYLTFYASSFCAMVIEIRRGDLLVAKTDPPLLSVLAATAARLRGALLINWVQDLFPEVAEKLGIRLPRLLFVALVALRNASLRSASMNVALGMRMAERLITAGVAPERIRIIANWAERTPPPAKPVTRSALRSRLKLQDKFVVGYSGNLGRAHDFETMLGAAARLRTQREFVFLMIGGGAGMQRLQHACHQQGLTNVLFHPYLPRAELADALAAADVHWLSLQAELEGLIMPSKFYGILAAGRPTVFIGDPDGELAREIVVARCGAALRIGDSASLAELLLAWKSAPAVCEQLGTAGRRLYEERFAAERAFEAWREVARHVSL